MPHRTLRLLRAAALALVAIAMFEIALNPTPASAVVVDTPASVHGALAR